MENFIFALDATLPIFLLILSGYLFKRFHILNDAFIAPANTFNFTITLPILLFQQISKTDIINTFDLTYVLFCIFATSFCFFALWICTRKFMKQKEMRGAFVQASFRGSAAVLGIAFIINIYDDSGMAPMMIIGAVPLYNIFSVIVLSVEGGKQVSLKETCISILKNPILIAIVIGMIASLTQLQLPNVVDKTLQQFAQIASPLALITIGVAFQGKEAPSKIKISSLASIIKLIVMPALFLPLAYYLGFRDSAMVAILIMLGSPTTASCYIMAQQMNNDEVLTSSTIVMTTLLSSITLTFWIYVLHVLQAI